MEQSLIQVDRGRDADGGDGGVSTVVDQMTVMLHVAN